MGQLIGNIDTRVFIAIAVVIIILGIIVIIKKIIKLGIIIIIIGLCLGYGGSSIEYMKDNLGDGMEETIEAVKDKF